MSIDIMRKSCLRLRLYIIYFENRVANYVDFFKLLERKYEKHGLAFLICLAKEMQHIIFYAHVHAYSHSYIDED